MTKEEQFIDEIYCLRAILTIRVDMLHKHCKEYRQEEKPVLALNSALKAKQLIMVINSLDKALKIVG